MMTKNFYFWNLIKGFALSAVALNSVAQGVNSAAERDALARSAYARGDIPRAAAALNESVRVNPFDPVALNNLAVNYAAQGDYQNAMALLERALRIAPNRSDIMNNHANLRAWMAQDNQTPVGSRGNTAPLNFQRAEDLPPNLPPLWVPPPVLQNPPVVQQGLTTQNLRAQQALQNAYQPYPASTAQQQYQPVPGYGQVPGNLPPPVPTSQAYPTMTQGQAVYQTSSQPIPVYQQAAPAQQAVLLSPTAAPAYRRPAVVQQSVPARSQELQIVRKKKRPVAVDCKVEP